MNKLIRLILIFCISTSCFSFIFSSGPPTKNIAIKINKNVGVFVVSANAYADLKKKHIFLKVTTDSRIKINPRWVYFIKMDSNGSFVQPSFYSKKIIAIRPVRKHGEYKVESEFRLPLTKIALEYFRKKKNPTAIINVLSGNIH